MNSIRVRNEKGLTFGVLYSILVAQSLVSRAWRTFGVVGWGATWSTFDLLLTLVTIDLVLLSTCWLRICWRNSSVSRYFNWSISKASQNLLACLRTLLTLEVSKRVTISNDHAMIV